MATSRPDGRRLRPGTLVAGLVFLAVAALYALDSDGRLHVPPYLALPATAAGLALGRLATALTRAARTRRRVSTGSDGTGGAR